MTHMSIAERQRLQDIVDAARDNRARDVHVLVDTMLSLLEKADRLAAIEEQARELITKWREGVPVWDGPRDQNGEIIEEDAGWHNYPALADECADELEAIRAERERNQKLLADIRTREKEIRRLVHALPFCPECGCRVLRDHPCEHLRGIL